MAARFFCLLLFAIGCSAQVVPYTQALVEKGDLADARILASRYRRQFGNTSEALAAMSWVARGELAAGQEDQADKDAQEVEHEVRASLATRKLDSDPYLPIALGASFEVEAQVMVAKHQRSEALQLLETEEREFRGTSVETRLQKNILLMTLVGHPLPDVRGIANTWKGKPVLFFFWAHWCPDCKVDGPVIAKLASEFEPKGLIVVAPTRLYGYTAQEETASPASEKQFIDQVFQHYYAAIPKVVVPLDTSNFERFGVSTTPTIVAADRRGIVRLYHPGVMDEASLRAALTVVTSER